MIIGYDDMITGYGDMIIGYDCLGHPRHLGCSRLHSEYEPSDLEYEHSDLPTCTTEAKINKYYYYLLRNVPQQVIIAFLCALHRYRY